MSSPYFLLKKEIDTICAVSSPEGEGAISIIRASGKKSIDILKSIFHPYGRFSEDGFPTPRTVYTGRIKDPYIDRNIDEANAVFFKGPKTYTGEDLFEIYPHGGVFNTRYILDIILRFGARLAYKGEFTRRAVINGKINTLQAEAVLEIIKANSIHNLLIANNQLNGRLEEKINEIRDIFLYLLATVEALIDFPEEEFSEIDERFLAKSERLSDLLANLMDSYSIYEKSAGGIRVVIAGKPNAGKSSILNALLQKKRAIVSEIEGTTRDYIEENLFLFNKNINIIDTAGIRQSGDKIEEEGVRITFDQIARSDLVLYIFDASSDPHKEEFDAVPFKSKNIIPVLNKTDLVSEPLLLQANKGVRDIMDKNSIPLKSVDIVNVSAVSENGVDSLKKAIYSIILDLETASGEDAGITTLRQKNLIGKSFYSLKKAIEKYRSGEPLELIAIDLRDALEFLDEIIGIVSSEDVLDTLFKEFCIGK